MVVHTDIDNYLQFLKLQKKAEKGNLQAKKLHDKLLKKYSNKKYIELYQVWYLKNLLHQAHDLKKPRAIFNLKKLEKTAACKKEFLDIKLKWGEPHARELIKKLFGKKMLITILDSCI
jgi:hypothetical protein